MKIVMIANIIIKSVFVVCVTILSIRFNRIDLLWWFVLVPVLGYGYKETPITHPTEKGGVEE